MKVSLWLYEYNHAFGIVICLHRYMQGITAVGRTKIRRELYVFVRSIPGKKERWHQGFGFELNMMEGRPISII